MPTNVDKQSLTDMQAKELSGMQAGGNLTRKYYDDQRAAVQTRVSGSVEFRSVGLANAGLFEIVFDSVGVAHPTEKYLQSPPVA